MQPGPLALGLTRPFLSTSGVQMTTKSSTLSQQIVRASALTLTMVALGACAEQSVFSPDIERGPVIPQESRQALRCSANVAMRSVSCTQSDVSPSGVQTDVISGQGVNVLLASSNV